jgi:hypothetical protein
MSLFYIILWLLLSLDLANSQAVRLIVNGDKNDKIIENTVVYFSCISNRSDSSTRFEELELALSQPNSKKESLCFGDCEEQSTSGQMCESFLRETMLNCPNECFINGTLKNCTFKLQRVSLAADHTAVRCAHGTKRSTIYNMNVEVATKFVSQEVIHPDQLLVVDKNRTAFVFYEMNSIPESTSTTSYKKVSTESYKNSLFNEVAIECVFRASQSPSVQWSVIRTKGDNSQIEEELSSAQEPIKTGLYQWLARLIVPAKRESAGKYRCLTKYETTGETITGDMILQPYYGQANAPFIKMLSSDLIIGEPILFECNVEDSNPPPVLNWDSPSSDIKSESKHVQSDYGGKWMSSQLEFPLKSTHFGKKIQCKAAHYGEAVIISNEIEINKMTFKKKLFYNESEEFGILNEVNFQMHLNKSCLLMEATVSNLLRTFSAVFCTPDSIRTITGGLISNPATFFQRLDEANESFALNVRQGVLRATLQVSGQTFGTAIKLQPLAPTNENAFAMLMEQVVLLTNTNRNYLARFKCGQNTFNKSSYKVSFNYSLNGTTVTNNYTHWIATFINGYLPTHAVSELCIENPANGMYIGIAIDSYPIEKGLCHTDVVAWHTPSSSWCNGVSGSSLSVVKTPSTGSKIRMVFNPEDGGLVDYLQEDGSSYLNSPIVLPAKLKMWRHRLRFAIWPYSGSTARLY